MFAVANITAAVKVVAGQCRGAFTLECLKMSAVNKRHRCLSCSNESVSFGNTPSDALSSRTSLWSAKGRPYYIKHQSVNRQSDSPGVFLEDPIAQVGDIALVVDGLTVVLISRSTRCPWKNSTFAVCCVPRYDTVDAIWRNTRTANDIAAPVALRLT